MSSDVFSSLTGSTLSFETSRMRPEGEPVSKPLANGPSTMLQTRSDLRNHGARGGTRTPTSFRTLAPKASASANSATLATRIHRTFSESERGSSRQPGTTAQRNPGSGHRDEVQQIVVPVVEVALGHVEHSVGSQRSHEVDVVAHDDHRSRPATERVCDRRQRWWV
jgi:hypothetical protein